MDKRSAPTAAGSPNKKLHQDDGASTSAAGFFTLLCHLCGVAFTAANNLKKHIATIHGTESFPCEVCDKVFNRKANLDRHIKSHTSKQKPTLECVECNKVFSRPDNLARHLAAHQLHTCVECGKDFQTKAAMIQHQKSHTAVPLARAGDPQPSTDPRDPTSATCPPKGCRTALKGSFQRHRAEATEEDVDLPAFLWSLNHADLIREAVKEKKGIKFFVSANIQMVRPRGWIQRGAPRTYPYFTSHCQRVLEVANINELLEAAYEKIEDSVAQYLREGSGWVIGRIMFVDLVISTYTPMKGSSYIPLPDPIAKTRGVINVQNTDQKCFLWAILSALHPVDFTDHANRVSKYTQHEDSLEMGDLSFPMTPEAIPKFEKLNQLRINLFGYREKQVFPIYISDGAGESINLLLISSGTQQHYCWIKDFNKLMHSNTKNRSSAFYCLYCLHRFSQQRLLDAHEESCRHHGPQKIRLPEGDERFMTFKSTNRSLPVPYTIFADFESMIVPMAQQAGSKTERTAEHRPASFCYIIVGSDGQLVDQPFLYRGEDCVNVFLDQLKIEEAKIELLKKENKPMNMSDHDEARFQAATDCHICKKPLGNCIPHRDHDHETGVYRGAAHPRCNLNFKNRPFIPVVLHNLRGYDSHLIMQEIGKHKDSHIDCLANNFEKYISFTFRSLRFIDSLQFMNESLDKLVSNLRKSGMVNFKLTSKCFRGDQMNYVTSKGFFPYEYFDSLERLEELALPPQAAFHSTLTDSDISDEDYTHAGDVWAAFGMTNFGDYHDLYLKTDVLLLADVFQHFRSVCQKCYDLDPCHYFTSPGLAWDAALKKSDITLELITDPDMYLFVEKGTRGGISMISNRYAEANNTSLPDYDPSKPSSHIAYLDANNLYGWAMSQPLPVGGFEWVEEVQSLDVTQLSDDGDIGYMLEVDLTYPEELHDAHSDYPLAPERMPITEEMLSPYSKQLLDDLGMKHMSKIEKLVPNLNNKTKYIVHSRNLSFYLKQGMILTHIHRALKFNQSPWLKTYIDFNTAQRTLATTDFEKNFFKLMNNAVFGKTMENLRKRRNVKLVHKQDKYEKLVAMPGFQSARRFCEDLVGVEMSKTSLFLNRPIYVGFAVLELSKILMYQFYYDVLKKKYGDNIKLLFTDTDSVLVHIFTDDLHADMGSFADQLDTSDYPVDHPLYSLKNKKVIGKFKDELNSVPIVSYVGLRAKMYSIKPLVGKDKQTAKGVSKTVVKNDFHHEDYRRVLLARETKTANMAQIRSASHHLYSLKIQKLGLSSADDKRYVLPDGCDTWAHGHYRTQL